MFWLALTHVHLLVSPLVRVVAAVELRDGPQPGQAHQSEGQEGQSHVEARAGEARGNAPTSPPNSVSGPGNATAGPVL